MPRIFISYRRADSSDAAGRIYDRLAAAFGPQNIFKDVDSIPAGADFAQEIATRLAGCQVVIVVIGRFWLTPAKQGGPPRLHDPKDFVRIEVEHALRKKLFIIPALVSKASMPGSDKLPKSLHALATRHALPVRPDPDFHRDMDRLIEAIRSRFPSVEPPPIPVLGPSFSFAAAPPHYLKPPRRWSAGKTLGCIVGVIVLILSVLVFLYGLMAILYV